jgi:hypothetical protein
MVYSEELVAGTVISIPRKGCFRLVEGGWIFSEVVVYWKYESKNETQSRKSPVDHPVITRRIVNGGVFVGADVLVLKWCVCAYFPFLDGWRWQL